MTLIFYLLSLKGRLCIFLGELWGELRDVALLMIWIEGALVLEAITAFSYLCCTIFYYICFYSLSTNSLFLFFLLCAFSYWIIIVFFYFYFNNLTYSILRTSALFSFLKLSRIPLFLVKDDNYSFILCITLLSFFYLSSIPLFITIVLVTSSVIFDFVNWILWSSLCFIFIFWV